jgi:hypothetical protein
MARLFFRCQTRKPSAENFNRPFFDCLCQQISGNVADLTVCEHELQPGCAFNFYLAAAKLIAVFAICGRAFTSAVPRCEGPSVGEYRDL